MREREADVRQVPDDDPSAFVPDPRTVVGACVRGRRRVGLWCGVLGRDLDPWAAIRITRPRITRPRRRRRTWRPRPDEVRAIGLGGGVAGDLVDFLIRQIGR